jgi:manganese oxidase
MTISRRDMLLGTALLAGGAVAKRAKAAPLASPPATGRANERRAERLPYTPVVTPNGATLPCKIVGGVKEFHLVAEPVKREFAPGMVINCWGYNGMSPGPTIEAV